MSKKKLRYKKHRKNRRRLLWFWNRPDTSVKDSHHLCFTRKSWSGTYANMIRNFHYCKMPLPKYTLHQFIHDNMSHVPPPSELAAEQIYMQLLYLDGAGVLHDTDPIERRLKLLAGLFDCIAQPTADAFREQADIVRRFYEKPP